MSGAPVRKYSRIFPEYPPTHLIPRGYVLKVALLWISFFGVFAGIAGSGGPFAVFLPISLCLFVILLTAMLRVRTKEKPLWMYKEARDCFIRHRYDKALGKLENILRLRPDMERELFGAVLICRQRTGDRQGAKDYCRQLIERGTINYSTDLDLLLEILHAFGVKINVQPGEETIQKLTGEVLIERLKEYCFNSREEFF